MAARGNTSVPVTRILLLVAIPLMIYLAYSAARNAWDIYTLKQQGDEIRSEIDVLKARNSDLKRQADYLSTDGYIEMVAREELNLVKPGEVAVIVVAPSGSDTSVTDSITSSRKKEDMPNWGQWLHFFLKDGE